MLTVILNAGFGVLVLLAFGLSGGANWGWSVFWGVVAFAAAQVAAGFLIQRRVKAGMAGVQMDALKLLTKRARHEAERTNRAPVEMSDRAARLAALDDRTPEERAADEARAKNRSRDRGGGRGGGRER